ncbi:TRAP transporter substrate-binding protein [Virgibacillus oceani]
MKKIIIFLSVIITTLFIISGCNSNENSLNSEAKILQLANVTTASDDIGVTLEDFAKSVEEETNGEIQVEVYNDGVLGSESKTTDHVRQGQIQMQLTHSISILEQYDPIFGIDELPYLFKSREDARAAYDGEVGNIINEKAENNGFKVLAYWEHGVRHITNNVKPIKNLEDLDGIKLRVTSDTRREVFEKLGASPVTMGFTELYSALQQGVMDGQENSINNIYTSNIYEVQDYLSLSSHMYSSSPLIINLDVWNSLSEDERKVLEENAVKYRDIQRERHVEQEEENIKRIVDEGVELNEVDIEEFEQISERIMDELSERFGEELINAVEKYR